MEEKTVHYHATTNEEQIFEQFRFGLERFAKDGTIPSVANQDLAYAMSIQQRRLERYHLIMKLQLEADSDITSVHQSSLRVPLFNSIESFTKFNYFLYMQMVHRTKAFTKEDKTIYSKQDYVGFCQVIIHPKEQEPNMAKTAYTCPNCGAISTLEVLQKEGCPYCKTKYLMKDLYPKVTNYYSIDGGMQSKDKVKGNIHKIFVVAFVCSLIMNVQAYFSDPNAHIILSMISFGIGLALIFFILYAIYSLSLFGHLLKVGIQSSALLAKTAGSKQAITKKVKRWNAAFDYEYFEGKVLSIARLLLLSDDPDHCIYYQGPTIASRYQDVIDLEYRGGIALKKMHKDGNAIFATFELFLTITYYDDHRIKVKNERIVMDMHHDASVPIDPSFSCLQVHCSHCGASFDAFKSKCCPYCDTPYDISKQDWVVTNIQ